VSQQLVKSHKPTSILGSFLNGKRGWYRVYVENASRWASSDLWARGEGPNRSLHGSLHVGSFKLQLT
jgi:hypothetical protein